MKKMRLVVGILAAALVTPLSLHAGSFIAGGCSDPYHAPVSQKEETAETPSGRPVGLFHRGGCTTCGHQGCGSGQGLVHGALSGGVVYQNQPVCQQASAMSVQASSFAAAPAYGQAIFQPAPVYAPNFNAHPMIGQQPCSQPSFNFGGVASANVAMATDQRSLMDCGPVASYQVVLEPKYFTETRAVPTTEYQTETRYRTRKVARQIPVEVQDYRTLTVMVPKQETKTVDYTVLVPQTGEKSVEVVDTVPVWTDITESYTVKVPNLIDVPEEYKVRVPQLSDQEFTYTVQVPFPQTETRMQTVTNAVPVSKTRTVQTYQPVTRTQTVTKDYGHWEDRVEEVSVAGSYSSPQYAPAVNYAPASAVSYAPSVSYAPAGCSPSTGYGYTGSVGSGRGQGCFGRLFHRGGCGVGGGHHGCGQRGCNGGCGTGTCSTGGCGLAGGCGNAAGGAYGVSGGCGDAYASVDSSYSQAVYAAPDMQVASLATVYSTPTTQTVTRRVWVPNVVNEEVQVVENVAQAQEVTYTVLEQQSQQVPYEFTYLVYRPETRTGTRKVVNYVEETRTRSRKVVQYNEETRTRTRKQLSYKQETRTETIPYVSYTTEKRTKEVNFTINVPETKVEPFTTTRYDTVMEDVTEQYTVSVPVASSKEVQVQVCRMIPKLVPVTIYPCQMLQGSGAMGNGCGSTGLGASPAPCSSCSPAMQAAPAACANCQPSSPIH
jgi:hypothetical protein